MKFLFSIFFSSVLVFVLVALPTSNASACGGACCKKEQKEVKKEKKNCCSKKKKNCNDNKENQDDKNGCDGDCGKKGCHCPQQTSYNTSMISPIIELKFPKHNYSYKSQTNWYYLEKIPNSVYLSVWLPPKISC